MKVILSNRLFKGIATLLLFITGSISLLAAIPATYQQQFGLSSSGSILADIFNLKPASVVSLADEEAATVRTNKSHYDAGETAKITGEHFGSNETVTLQVLHTDGTSNTGSGHGPWTVTTDGDGVFLTTWYVDPDDSVNSKFQLTAVSATASASTTFDDPGPSADLDQCRNGRIINPKDCIGDGSGVSGWVNGNVGQSDGHYIEGYSIPYRMRLADVTAGDWTLDVGYDTVHSSKHAIDFLTHYDLIGGANFTPTVPPHPLVFNHTAECIDPSDSWIGGAANENNCAGVASTSTFAIPKPIIPNSLGPNPPGDFPCDSPYPGGTVLAGAISCPGSTFDAISGAGQAYMTMWNGTITSIQYVSGEQNVVSGTGQQHTMMRIYFHVSAAQAAADGGNVDLGWGGHIGRTQDWGTNNSAGGISGSPYHMNLHGLCAGSTPNDGTLCTDGGSQDRSLSAAAVFLTGTIRIIKNMQAGSQDGTFHYTTTGANLSPSFDLTTVGGTAETIITGLQPGAKTVTETGPASPFLFVSLTCDDPDGGTTINGQTANIDLDGGETVTCTYTNREDFNATHARIIVVKEVPGTGDTTQFTFTPGPGFPNPGSTFTAPFNLTDGGSKDSCGVGDNCLPPATYSVGETPNSEYTTTATCTSSVAGKAPDDPSAIHLEAGETKTCTFTNTPKAPSLSIQKTADAASVSAGDAIGFTITVTNASGATVGTAKGVTLSDALPAGSGVDWSIASQTGGASCVINGAPPTETLACGPIDLAPGASFSVHVTSNTTEASCKAYPNTAAAQATNNAQVTANATETVLCPNLSINKTADAASVSAGDTIGFTVTVTNSAAAGTGTAKGVTLSDALPAGSGVDWSIAGQSGGASCVINGAPPTETLACGPIDLAPGASFSVHVTSSTTEASCKAYPNTATADATNAPAITANATETVLCPNLSITKTADAVLVDAGTSIGFTITVSNSGAAGTGTALGVTLSDALPAGSGVDWTIQSQSGGASCVINGAPPTETLACGPIDLAPGASFSVHVTSATTGASCKAYPNTATADATNSPPATAQATETVQCSDVSVTKTADAASVDAPGNVGFTITVHSNGPADAQNVTLVDTLPTNGGLSWSIDGGTGAASCSIGGGTLTCAFGTMAAGTSLTVHISSPTTADTCGTVNNTVTVSANFEPNTGNNTASASEAVLCGTIVIIKNAKPQTGSFSFTGTGPGYNSFNLSGDPTGGGNINTQKPLVAGTYTATEATQLGWILTGIGGDPNSPFSCVVTGGHGSTGLGDLSTQAVTINLKGGDTVTCTFENTGSGVTRTQGFWATHTPLAQIAWFGGTAFGHTFPGVPDTNLGNPPCRAINDLPTLMGGFWSNISKTTTNKKRSPLDQARMQLLQQLLAAELNYSAFGTTPSGGFATIESWENAYCGTNQNAINAAQQAAGSFNSQGDNSTFTPGTSADSKNARAIANYVTWDVLP